MKDVKNQEIDLPIDAAKNQKQLELDMIEQSESTIKSIKNLLQNILANGKTFVKTSFLTKIAMAWDDLHWIFKGIIFLLLSAVTVVPAVLLQLWPIYIITGIVSLFYIGISVLFYFHADNEAEKKNTDYMQDIKIAYGLTCVIESMFSVFKSILIDLRVNVDAFARQNDKLESEVNRFGNCNETLEDTLDNLSENVIDLNSQVGDISDTALKFKMTVDKNEKLVEKYRQHIETSQDNHKKESESMQQQIRALSLLKDKLHIQVEFATKQTEILKNAVGSLVNTQKQSEEHMVSFHQKLMDLLDREEKNLTQFVVRFEELGNKFQDQITIIEECNRKYKKIIDSKEAALPEIIKQIETASALKKYGLYANPCHEERSALAINQNSVSCC